MRANNPSFYAIFSSLIRSATSFLIWIILPFFYSEESLEDLSYKYAIVFGLISVIDFGGLSNVMINELKIQRSYKAQIEVLFSVFLVQVTMAIFISIFLLNYGFNWEDIGMIFYPIVIYFLIWQSFKKYRETTTRENTIYWKDIIVTISAFLTLCFFRNYEIKFLFYLSPIFLVIQKLPRVKSFKFKIRLKRISSLIMKSFPMLFGSIASFVAIYLERQYVANFSSQNSQYQYILTIALQLSSFLVLPIQGIHNRIWSYETTNKDSMRFINFVLAIAIILGGIAAPLLVYLTPVLYSVDIDRDLIVMAVISGQLMIVVQLFTTKLGSKGRFRKLGFFTTLTAIMNLLLVVGLSYSSNIGFLANRGVSIVFLKYIILSAFQTAFLIYSMRPLCGEKMNLRLIGFTLVYLLLLTMFSYWHSQVLLLLTLSISLICYWTQRDRISGYLVKI